MDGLLTDFRYAVRRLRASPGFTVVAAMTLALGIGTNTAMFCLINGLMFQDLPVRDAERLVNIYRSRRAGPFAYFSYPDLEELVASTQTIEDVIAYRPVRFTMQAQAGTRIEYGEAVTLNYFQALGVRPVAGRAFLPSDAADPHVMVISADWWSVAYGRSSDVLGKTVLLHGELFTVIGVAPPRFGGLSLPTMARARFFIPVQGAGTLAVGRPSEGRSGGGVLVKGWLRPGVTLEKARAELRSFAGRFERSYPSSLEGWPPRTFEVAPVGDVYIRETMDRIAVRVGVAAMAAVVLVLLIACANLANLLLARGEARGTELAVRAAMGAGRLRLVRMIVTEHGVVAGAGGVLGLLLTAPMRLIAQIGAPAEFEGISLTIDPPLNAQVVVFAGAATVLTLIVLGIPPALKAAGRDVAARLGSVAIAAGLRPRAGLPGFLVTTQVAASVLLLSLGGLFGRRAFEEANFKPSLDAKNAVMVDSEASPNGYDEERAYRFYETVLGRLRESPEVASVGLASALPGEVFTTLSLDDEAFDPRRDDRRVAFASVTPGALDALGLPILHGRAFEMRDMDGGPLVALVGQQTAAALWPHGRAVGERFRVDAVRTGTERPLVKVVGVVKDAGTRSLDRSGLQIYVPLSKSEFRRRLHVLAKSRGNPAGTLGAMTRIVREVDSNFALSRSSSVEDYLAEGSYSIRAATWFLSVLGALGLLLASIGLYGVVSYSVACRTREIGIRSSLGASRRDIVTTVLREGLVSTAVGCAAGLLLAVVAGRVASRMWFGVPPSDPVTLACVCGIVTVVSAIACYLPARRAARVEPIVALRVP